MSFLNYLDEDSFESGIGVSSSYRELQYSHEIYNNNNKKEIKMSLMDKLLKAGSDKVSASVLSKSEFFEKKATIPTSIPALNIALGGELDSGLIPGLLMVSGASKSFKTVISLFMVAAYLKQFKDAVCIFYDSEFGSTPAYFKNFEIDTDRVLHIPVENVEQLKFDIVNRMKDITKKDKVIIFIDSIGNLASKKEVEDAENEKSVTDMTRAKSLKSLWRIVTPMFTLREIPCIAINHIYMEQGAMYPKAIVSGGTGGIYSSNAIWIITKSQIKGDDGVEGFNFKINIEKSRLVKEKSQIPLEVTFNGGISKYSGMLDLAMESGHIVKPKNGWYQRVDKGTGELIGSALREKATASEECLGKVMLEDSFRKFIKNKYQLGAIQIQALETPIDSDDDISDDDMTLVTLE